MKRATGLLLALGLLAPARTWAQATVLAAGFQPESPESAGLAALLSSALEEALGQQAAFALLTPERVPPLGETGAQLYLDVCPAGEQLGCTFVVAQHAGADFAVTGAVLVQQAGAAVWVSLVDVGQAREALSFDLDLAPGGDQVLMERVAALLGRLVAGELGAEGDIRQLEVPGELRALDEEELAGLLEEEVGLPTRGLRRGMELRLPTFTPDDLERQRQEEGLAEWERLGLSERAWLAWKNSGLTLSDWRARAVGRALQVLIRPRAAFLWGPVEGRYHARFAQDLSLYPEDTLVEVYAWQSAGSGTGGGYGLELGFGLTPAVELELGLLRVHGRFYTLVQQEDVGEVVIPAEEIATGNASLLLSAGMRMAPAPARAVRPVLGLGAAFWRGSAVDDHVDLSTLEVPLPTFAAPVLVGVRAVGGAELRLGPRWDLVAQVPLLLLLGDGAEVHDEGGEALPAKAAPGAPLPFAAGLELCAQLRLGGRDPQRRGPRGGQLEDEEELDVLE